MPAVYYDLAPKDFYAWCEGYEAKKYAERDFVRQQTYILASPYMKKGESYKSFKNGWRFNNEIDRIDAKGIPRLSPQETQDILASHQKIIDKLKK